MEAHRPLVIVLCVGLYMALSVIIGIWAIRRTRSTHDFFVAGRQLGPLVVSMAVFSSTLSGFGFVGGPGLVYNSGLSSMWMVCVSSMGYALAFFLVAKRVRMMAELRDTISLPDVLADRYNSEAVRLLTGITILLGVLGYLATQILAMAVVMQSILSAIPLLAGISLITCTFISLAVLVFYSVTGGMIASVYTDLVQGMVMVVAGILVIFAAVAVFDGGMAEAAQYIFDDDPEAIMPFGTGGMVVSLAWAFMFGFGLAAQPHIVTKFMMTHHIKDNRIILPITLLGYAISAFLWISIGVIMHAVVVSGLIPPLEEADKAAPVFLSLYANPLLAGIVFAGLFAAIMSTADAFLNIGAAVVVHDVPRALLRRTLDNELFWARMATLSIAMLAAFFALYAFYYGGQLVAILGAFGWGMFAAALMPLIVIGLNWKRATWQGALATIIVSIILNLAVQLFAVKLPYGMAGGFLAMLLSAIVFILVSLITPAQPLAEDIEAMMEL